VKDQTLHRLGLGLVLLVAVLSACGSFVHIVDLAVVYRQPPLAAWLLPFALDGEIAACSLFVVRAHRLDPDSRVGLAQFGIVFGIIATLACNVGYGVLTNYRLGLVHIISGSLLSGAQPVAFLVSAEVAISAARKAARQKRGDRPGGAPGDSRAAPANRATRPGPNQLAAPPAPATAPAAEPLSQQAAPVAAPPARATPSGRPSRAEPPPAEALHAYRASVDAGHPLSARQLAADHLGGNRHAAGRVIDQVRDDLANELTPTLAAATLNGDTPR
jgi:Protein of unknown function (DUF2637)